MSIESDRTLAERRNQAEIEYDPREVLAMQLLRGADWSVDELAMVFECSNGAIYRRTEPRCGRRCTDAVSAIERARATMVGGRR
jgi:hypothetical protein